MSHYYNWRFLRVPFFLELEKIREFSILKKEHDSLATLRGMDAMRRVD